MGGRLDRFAVTEAVAGRVLPAVPSVVRVARAVALVVVRGLVQVRVKALAAARAWEGVVLPVRPVVLADVVVAAQVHVPQAAQAAQLVQALFKESTWPSLLML